MDRDPETVQEAEGERRPWYARVLRPAWYLAIVSVIAVFAVIVPNPPKNMRNSVLKSINGSASIVMLGPSVVRHFSICDKDRRSLPEMLADVSGRSVSDLSYPGALLEDVRLAGVEAALGSASDIIIPTTYDNLAGWPTLDYRTMLFLWLVNPSFGIPVDFRWPGVFQGLAGKPDPVDLGFTYDGVTYPDANGIHAKWFEYEKKNETCPETVTHDWKYLKAYTWWRRIEAQPNPAMVPLIARASDYVRKKGKTLHIVMLPVNWALLTKLDPSWATAIKKRERRKYEELTSLGVSVLDLTELLPASDFSTAWCACTHFNEKGRLKVVTAIAAYLSARPGADGTAVATDLLVYPHMRRPE